MKKNLLKIGLVQTKVGDDTNENLEKTAAFIKKAARKGSEVVCLLELFAQRYFAQTRDDSYFELAEPVPGRLSNYLSGCAKDNGVVFVGGSIYERGDDGKLYNTSLVYD